MAINWISAQLGFGIVGAPNVVGDNDLWHYSLLQQATATLAWYINHHSYLIIVVGMGYSRQAVAIGIIFLVLSVWKNNFRNYTLLVILATCFHKSAILMLIFGLLIDTK